MKLVILFGPPAVGKMTVGQELEKITTLRLFHNHMSIELVHQFFDFGTPAFERLDRRIRFAFFEELAASDLDGLIFTYVWDFDEPADTDYIDAVASVFHQQGAVVSYVELKADLSERLKRNRDPHRLACKPSKRDIEASESSLRYFETNYRMHTWLGELGQKPLLTIDITSQEPQATAHQISDWLNQR
ncbi:AAA family ATPase [Fibrella forsythiae]|uniref:AAA family ATPase n=1 Tax=Fibrella forsythiae TaxID=2817061 RepID=A0ABS3JSN7_9BACT|nr:AAA family ATPase [Fibrella forsythiae]MBO0953028.1 AAA family ATPase [Fibrella forsythiae]